MHPFIKEKKFFILIIAMLWMVFLNKFYDEFKLKVNGVFVLGSFKDKTYNSESGYIYTYNFKFKNKNYSRIFATIASEPMKTDSLLFFIILPDNPKVCRQYETILVPSCIRLKDVPHHGWKQIPKSSCK